MTDDVPLTGSFKEKLLATKVRWAREGRGLTGEINDGPTRPRLPPGQHEVTDFPVLDLGVQPTVSPDRWQLEVGGLVERPLVWSWEDFVAQPQVRLVSDIHCVTTWSRFDNAFTGVSAAHLLDQVKPAAEARFVVFRSYDGYTTNVPLAHFAASDVLIAHSWQDEPLAKEHGGPVRVVIPQLYFWKSAKWVRSLTFLAENAPGYWEREGYHDVGDPWKEERYG